MNERQKVKLNNGYEERVGGGEEKKKVRGGKGGMIPKSPWVIWLNKGGN